MSITVKDIAKMAGVSHTTVLRAINGSSQVNPRTKEKILSIVKEYNYVANSLARNLAGKKSNTIGLLITDISNPMFAELARGADDILSAANLQTIIFNFDNRPKLASEGLHKMKELRVGGLLIAYPSIITPEYNQELEQLELPFVLLSRNFPGTADYVAFDDRLGGYLIGKHLMELGHRKVVCLAPEILTAQPTKFRLEGLRMAFQEYGVSLSEADIVVTGFQYEDGYKAADDILNRAGVTAVACLIDTLAIGVLRRLKEKNVSVPQEMAVSGFDDNTITPFLETSLTSVSLPKHILGQKAAQLLVKKISETQEQSQVPNTILIDPQLQIRESTAGRQG